jgi:signal transduction histidine kinase
MSQHPILSEEREPVLLEMVSSGRAIGFYAHFIAYSFTCVLVLVTAGGFPALLVGLGWGIGLVIHGLFALLVPLLRAARGSVAATRAARLPAPSARSLPAPDRARALEELSAAIAHEIRNPITAAKSLVQQIAEDPGAADSSEHARVAVEELDRVERSIAHLLRFAREEPFEPGPVVVSELIDSALELMRDRAERQGVRLERDLSPLPGLVADAEQLRKVLANLIGNALDAHESRPIADAWIRVSAGQNLAGDELWLRVADNGPGMTPQQREQAFQPFRTHKPGGTGLGLALARKVLQRHGGSIEIAEGKRGGAELLLVLPLAPERGP